MSLRHGRPARPRAVQIAAALYFLFFLAAVTWPGLVPFNRVHPLVLGLPFNMFWILLWVVGGALILFLADRPDRKERTEHGKTERER